MSGLSYKKDLLNVKSNKMIRVMRGGNILDSNYSFKDDDIFISSEFVKSELYLKKNYMITPSVTSMEHIGKIALIDKDYDDVVVGGFVLMLIPHFGNDFLSKYLLYAFSSKYHRDCCRSITHKSGQAFYNLSRDRLMDIYVPIPPLAEQHRIVSKIEELLPYIEKYEQAETQLTALNANFPELLKKSILQEAVQGKLVPQNHDDEPASVLLERIRAEKQALIKAGKIKKDKHESVIITRDKIPYEIVEGKERCIADEVPFDLPDNWEWVRLGSIGDWGSGATPSRSNADYYNGNIPWLKTGDLNDGIIYDIPEKISELALEKTSVRLNPIGSVLIAMYGATIGKLGILSIPATTNQACCACLPIIISNKYLFYFLMAHKSCFIKSAEGGAQPNISKEKIVSTFMPVPPLAEQKRIVTKIEELTKIIDSISK